MNEHKDILLVFMDIDYLRRINNDFGRAAGDEVIVAAARCIENVLEQSENVIAQEEMSLR